MEPATPCLSDDTVLAFVEGRLGAEALAACHRHFDDCEACQWLVAEAAHAIGTSHDPAVSQPLGVSLRIGSVVGDRYRVERFIARGGMGEVYEAFDRVLNQRIALKTVKSTISDSPKAAQRLKAEVQLARRVTHPNVCRLYDLGSQRLTQKVEIHFLSMEYIDGISLREKLAQDGRLDVRDAVGIARQLLGGLSAAHEAGTLHRDFKPDNVMLRTANREPTAVIMDFGLAWALDAEAVPRSARSNEPLIGTLTYMAPEQVEGTPLGIGTDLYAFGLVLFEMLTGRLPFVGESPATTALKRLSERAPAPSRFNPEVPEHLDRIVLRCLERLPENRYASASDVLAALDRDAARRPRPPWLRRSAKAVAGIAGAALAIVVAVQALAPTPPPVVQPHVTRARAPELRASRRDDAEATKPAAALAPVAPVSVAPPAIASAVAKPARHVARNGAAPPQMGPATPRGSNQAAAVPAVRAISDAPGPDRVIPADLMVPKSFQSQQGPLEK
ncbi:MAG TPA: protein kinase [Polyangiaceae bacterium]|nr:protein kinase [Polyangiaceae bacterium]